MLATRRSCLSLVILALCCGCHKSSSHTPTRLQPPPETGSTVIEMNGTWEVMIVDKIDEFSHGIKLDYPWSAPVPGSQVLIEDGQFKTAGTTTLVNRGSDSITEVYTYLNAVDGRHAFFDYGSRTRPNPNIADGGSSRLQFALGSSGPDEMTGLTAFEVSGLAASARGLYRVVLERR